MEIGQAAATAPPRYAIIGSSVVGVR